MAARLAELRDRERNPAIVSAYRAVMHRLHGLAYRLQTRPTPKVHML